MAALYGVCGWGMLTIWASGQASASSSSICGGGAAVGAVLRHRLGGRDTHVGGHRGDEDDASAALRDHVPGGLARGEERAVHVDVVQTLYPVKGVVERGVVLDDACGQRQESESETC